MMEYHIFFKYKIAKSFGFLNENIFVGNMYTIHNYINAKHYILKDKYLLVTGSAECQQLIPWANLLSQCSAQYFQLIVRVYQ